MSGTPRVVYALPDKVGGVATIVANLLEYRRPDAFSYHAVLTHNRLHADARLGQRLPADAQRIVEFELPTENMYTVARRLARAIGSEPGVLVCNDIAEMLMLTVVDLRKTVVQILHGDYEYYYGLAETHEPLVHAFVAYSRTVYETLLRRLPHRRETIFWLPYGVPLPDEARRPVAGPLRLLFVGRLDEAKGVFDLPEIDRTLVARGVEVTWTVVGDGPAAARLREAWPGRGRVSWLTATTPRDVLAVCARHDVLVLPSRAEGLSVATVEAMSVGLVPVVSDLPSMAEIVDGAETGYRPAVGDTSAFADAIATLANDRRRLETMSRAARQLAVTRFDARERTAAYQALFARWRELYRPRPAKVATPYRSRLDKRWIPNSLVRLVRSTAR